MTPPHPILVRLATGATALAIVLTAGACGGGDDDKAAKTSTGGGDSLQTVTFQPPEDPGEEPFTEATDVEGDEEVEIPESREAGGAPPGEEEEEGQGPFGGTGSNRVCDRDLLIRSLRRHPDRLREWARVLDVEPTVRAVSRYIAKLHPVTLTRDTQVTNHNFVNGRAVPYQAILPAGTAVLADKYGRPVVRCRCGNPLKEPVLVKQATCRNCPANYHPPPPCDFYGRRRNYDRTYYRREYYSNGDFDEIYIRRHRRSRFRDCYEPYPDPPTVRTVRLFKRPKVEPPPQADTGLNCAAPRSQLEFEQCRSQSHPDQAQPRGEIDCNNPQTQTEVEFCRPPEPDAEIDPEPAPQHTEPDQDLPVCDPVDPHPPCRPG